MSEHDEEAQPRRSIALIPASSVRTERVNWLIDNWVPKKSMTLLAGREGLGKSTIACEMAARATRGELNAPPMNVVYLNTEDSRSMTVKPRLIAAGADMARVSFIDVTTSTGMKSTLTLPGDTSILAKALSQSNVGLVILDAAKSAMDSSLNGYKDDDVRQFLEPLSAMCDELDVAIIGLTHFGKKESTDPGKLMLGSVAWSQIARSVLSVAEDKKGGSLIVTNTKGNLARATVSQKVTLENVPVPTDDGEIADVGRAVWGDFTDKSATDFLGEENGDDEEKTDAEIWLEDYFTEHGPTVKKQVMADSRKAGFSGRTVERAFRSLGGESKHEGYPRVAIWSLPHRDSLATALYMRGGTGGTDGDLHKHGGGTDGGTGGTDGGTVTTVSPHGGTDGGTVTTTSDQRKQDKNTTKNSSSASLATYIEGGGATELTDADKAVLAVLSEYPMSARTLKGCFTKDNLETLRVNDLSPVLNGLVGRGLVVENSAGKYSVKVDA